MKNYDESTRREFIQRAGIGALGALMTPSLAAQEGKKLVLGFVGVAHIHTPEYIRLAKTRNDVQVKCVWDHDGARARACATELNARAADVKEIWSDAEISGVVICSETNRHHELVLGAAEAGKHIFVEKPLGMTGRESVEIAAAIEKKKLIFSTGYFMRGIPMHLYVKEQLGKENFGKVTRVRGSNCHSGSLGGWFDKEYRWMADRKMAGFGGFGDLGTHKIDILMWLFGEVEAVTAEIKPVTGRYGDCDESGEGLIRFKNGIIGTLAAGWVDVEDPVQLLISGTEGHAAVVDNHLYYRSKKLPESDSKEPMTNLPPGRKPPMLQFLDALAGGGSEGLVTAGEAARRVVVMEAMYTAARERKWVTV